MEKAAWADRISSYLRAPLDVQESRDADLPTDDEATRERKKASPLRSEAYLDYGGPPTQDENGDPMTPEKVFEHFTNLKSAFDERDVETELGEVTRAPPKAGLKR